MHTRPDWDAGPDSDSSEALVVHNQTEQASIPIQSRAVNSESDITCCDFDPDKKQKQQPRQKGLVSGRAKRQDFCFVLWAAFPDCQIPELWPPCSQALLKSEANLHLFPSFRVKENPQRTAGESQLDWDCAFDC